MDEQKIGSEPVRTGDEKVREALGELAAKNPRQSQIVELHVFGGLSKSKIADELGIYQSEAGSISRLLCSQSEAGSISTCAFWQFRDTYKKDSAW